MADLDPTPWVVDEIPRRYHEVPRDGIEAQLVIFRPRKRYEQDESLYPHKVADATRERVEVARRALSAAYEALRALPDALGFPYQRPMFHVHGDTRLVELRQGGWQWFSGRKYDRWHCPECEQTTLLPRTETD